MCIRGPRWKLEYRNKSGMPPNLTSDEKLISNRSSLAGEFFQGGAYRPINCLFHLS